jgi:HK97 family phage prohead protease/HK97 family phage major capsid protein
MKQETQVEQHETLIRKKYGSAAETRVGEIRAAETDGPALRLEGYAAKFDTVTNIGPFREKVDAAAFDAVLDQDVRFLINHEGLPLARTKNGTLKMEVRQEGLWMQADMVDTQASRDLYNMVQRGDIDQMSFGFTISPENWRKDESGVRVISKVNRLLDVSAVTFAAYPTTTLEARSAFSGDPETDALLDIEKDEPEAPQKEERQAEAIKSAEVNILQPKSESIMNLNELKALRAKNYEEHTAILRSAEENGRELSEAEEQRASYLVEEVARLDKKIKHKGDQEAMVARAAVNHGLPSSSEQKEIDTINGAFSLSRAVKQIMQHGKLDGPEAEWRQEAEKDAKQRGLECTGNISVPARAMFRAADNHQATAGESGAGFVPTVVPQGIQALRAPSAIERAGVTVINNAQGILQFPRIGTAATGGNVSEVANSPDAGMVIDSVTMNPERVTAKTVYSRELLMQGGAGVDALISGDLSAAINQKIDRDAFADIMADATVNIQGVDGTDVVLSAAVVNQMEGLVLADGADLNGAVWVMSPKAYELTKSLAQVANVTPLWEGGQFNRYAAIATPHLVDDVLDDSSSVGGQMLFGNFAQGGLLAFYSGLDLLADPYSLSVSNQVRLIATRYFDFAIRQGGALCKVDQLKAS